MPNEANKLTGAASLRYCISKLTRVAASKLPQNEGVAMVSALRKAVRSKGYRLTPAPAHEEVAGKHVGLFSEGRTVSAVIMDGNKVIDNPTSFKGVNSSILTSRLKVEKR